MRHRSAGTCHGGISSLIGRGTSAHHRPRGGGRSAGAHRSVRLGSARPHGAAHVWICSWSSRASVTRIISRERCTAACTAWARPWMWCWSRRSRWTDTETRPFWSLHPPCVKVARSIMPDRHPPDDPREWLNRARSALRLPRDEAPGVYLEEICYQAHQAASEL